ncbi:MAG: hypothetical protein HW391_1979 [Chloroflexi bacterium]|nr:hypothetical protein [Chloroflexota bacterium]
MPRSRLSLILAGAAVAAVLGGSLIFQQFLAGDDIARLTLAPAAASGAPSATPGNSTDPTGAGASASAPSPGHASLADLAGTWSIADGSIVGYRVREQLGGVTALTDAVGRTNAVTGTAILELRGDALVVAAGSFEADLTQLRSDNGRRDNRIRTIGLQSNDFPSATFVMGEAIVVPPEAIAGSTVEITMTGDLTIHGVTNRVSIAGQAHLSGGRIEIAAALTFPFEDFGMTPPDILGFVQVEDDATLEVLLSLARG